MSYSLSPYLIETETLRRLVGGGDEALLQSLLAESGLDEVDEESDDGEVPPGRAFRQLVMGDRLDPDSAHQYGYALEQLCRCRGERLDRGGLWEGIHWDVLQATGVDQVLDGTEPPVALPAINSFPAIGYLSEDQVAATVTRMGSGHLKTAAPSGRKTRPTVAAWLIGLVMRRITRREPMSAEDTRELLDEYESWLREAAEKRKALIFFYY